MEKRGGSDRASFSDISSTTQEPGGEARARGEASRGAGSRSRFSGEGWPGLGMGTRLGCRAGPAVHVQADASQRAQARSPGLGGVVLIGAESLQAPWPAYQPHSPHSHTYGESRLAHIVCGMSGQGCGAGGELGWLPPVHTRAALLTAVPPPTASSTFCAARLHSRCQRGLPRRFKL